jgi:uncharacterized damage-inducible protein DinB
MRALVTVAAILATGSIGLAAGTPPPSANPVSDAIRQAWSSARKNIRASADDMAEADYGFKPVDSVRSFGQILAHVAGANYEFCAAAKGEKSPHAEDEFEKSATTKAAITEALEGSLAYCDAVYKGVTDASAGQAITMPFDMGQAPRATALLGNIGHVQEHYGNLVTYFRIKGIVPPSSRR